jgi:hypothetical protein
MRKVVAAVTKFWIEKDPGTARDMIGSNRGYAKNLSEMAWRASLYASKPRPALNPFNIDPLDARDQQGTNTGSDKVARRPRLLSAINSTQGYITMYGSSEHPGHYSRAQFRT